MGFRGSICQQVNEGFANNRVRKAQAVCYRAEIKSEDGGSASLLSVEIA
jgi:hypothetical protein